MNYLVFHIVSGQSFFTGVILLIAAAVASIQTRPALCRLAVPGFLAGSLAIILSSASVPYWLVAFGTLATIAWCIARFHKPRRGAAAYTVIVFSLVAACCELPYHITPAIPHVSSRTLTVIGDSVTAGTGGDDHSETWPRIIAREHGIAVQDISRMGDTAARALKRVRKHQIDSSIVIVEIGGNDILGSTTPDQFASDLDALLAHLTAADRQVVMFELPLPPFYHAYGRIQRLAAAKHNVSLIPKRVFLSVIADRSSTLDSIHLSQSGHQLMAQCVWRLIGPACVEGRD